MSHRTPIKSVRFIIPPTTPKKVTVKPRYALRATDKTQIKQLLDDIAIDENWGENIGVQYLIDNEWKSSINTSSASDSNKILEGKARILIDDKTEEHDEDQKELIALLAKEGRQVCGRIRFITYLKVVQGWKQFKTRLEESCDCFDDVDEEEEEDDDEEEVECECLENYDGNASDEFIQLCLFGQVKYG